MPDPCHRGILTFCTQRSHQHHLKYQFTFTFNEFKSQGRWTIYHSLSICHEGNTPLKLSIILDSAVDCKLEWKIGPSLNYTLHCTLSNYFQLKWKIGHSLKSTPQIFFIRELWSQLSQMPLWLGFIFWEVSISKREAVKSTLKGFSLFLPHHHTRSCGSTYRLIWLCGQIPTTVK